MISGRLRKHANRHRAGVGDMARKHKDKPLPGPRISEQSPIPYICGECKNNITKGRHQHKKSCSKWGPRP